MKLSHSSDFHRARHSQTVSFPPLRFSFDSCSVSVLFAQIPTCTHDTNAIEEEIEESLFLYTIHALYMTSPSQTWDAHASSQSRNTLDRCPISLAPCSLRANKKKWISLMKSLPRRGSSNKGYTYTWAMFSAAVDLVAFSKSSDVTAVSSVDLVQISRVGVYRNIPSRGRTHFE